MIKKHEPRGPGGSPDKDKAPRLWGPEGLSKKIDHDNNRQPLRSNDTTILKNGKTNGAIVPYPDKHTLPDNMIQPGDPIDQLQRQAVAYMQHDPDRFGAHIGLWLELQKLKSHFKTLTPAPVEDPLPERLPPITSQQMNYLIVLVRKLGQRHYLKVKESLGISAKVPDLTKDEAYMLIQELTQRGTTKRISIPTT